MGVTRSWLLRRAGLPGLNGGGVAAAVACPKSRRRLYMSSCRHVCLRDTLLSMSVSPWTCAMNASNAAIAWYRRINTDQTDRAAPDPVGRRSLRNAGRDALGNRKRVYVLSRVGIPPRINIPTGVRRHLFVDWGRGKAPRVRWRQVWSEIQSVLVQPQSVTDTWDQAGIFVGGRRRTSLEGQLRTLLRNSSGISRRFCSNQHSPIVDNFFKVSWLFFVVFTARCTSAQRDIEIACRPYVRLSVTLVDQDRIAWKSWKLIAQSISPTPSLFVAQRPTPWRTWVNFWETRGGVGKSGVLERKSGNFWKRVKIEEKLLWIGSNHATLFWTVPFPTPTSHPFPRLEVHNPCPKLQSLLSQEGVKLYGLQIWPVDSSIHLNKNRLKIGRKGSVGVSMDSGLSKFSGYRRPTADYLTAGTGKVTKFKFCTHIHRLSRNKSPFKILGKVAMGVVKDSRNFSGHSCIGRIARSFLR